MSHETPKQDQRGKKKEGGEGVGEERSGMERLLFYNSFPYLTDNEHPNADISAPVFD